MSEPNIAARDERAEGTTAPEAPPGQAAPARKPIEAWESEKDIPGWLRAATRALHRIPQGRELLEEEFDEAVSRTRALALR
jgi:hypothetical protein